MRNDDYITTTEAARRAGLQYHTFMARVRRGWVKCKYFGRAVMIDRRDLERKINAH